MQPHTHFVMGGAIGSLMFPNDPILQGVAVVGAVLPDAPLVLNAFWDISQGHRPFSREKEGDMWFTAKEISHSPLLWSILILAGLSVSNYFGYILFSLGIGIVSHYLTDALTHCGSHFRKTDQSLLWPFYQMGWANEKLGTTLGIWEYRTYPTSAVKLKRPEAIVFGICVAIWMSTLIKTYL